jgi:glycosyltransferase involved in cell wall biosynthesis
MASGVSVIVCCYNSAKRLPQTLSFLAHQREAPACEVVLVDNGSTDDTQSVAYATWMASKTTIPLQLVVEPKPGLSSARAAGVARAKYDYMLFCDDDNWLADSYLAVAFELMQAHPRMGALGGCGSAVADEPLPTWFDKYKFAYACFAQGEGEGELTNAGATLYGAGLVVRKEAWVNVLTSTQQVLSDRSASTLSSGGDTELCLLLKAAGWALWYSPRLQFRHYLPVSRLSVAYLLQLNQSLARSSAQLLPHRYALLGKEINRLTWLKDTVYQLWLFIRVTAAYLLRANSWQARMQFDFARISLITIAGMRGSYQSAYHHLNALKDGR